MRHVPALQTYEAMNQSSYRQRTSQQSVFQDLAGVCMFSRGREA